MSTEPDSTVVPSQLTRMREEIEVQLWNECAFSDESGISEGGRRRRRAGITGRRLKRIDNDY